MKYILMFLYILIKFKFWLKTFRIKLFSVIFIKCNLNIFLCLYSYITLLST